MNLYNRYRALINIQHRVLNTSLMYYMYMSDNFYDRINPAGVSTEDLNEIYARLEGVEDALKTFKVAKNKLEQTVEVLTFTGVVRADLTSYAYSLNQLIEEVIEFDSFFIELNEKYLFRI